MKKKKKVKEHARDVKQRQSVKAKEKRRESEGREIEQREGEAGRGGGKRAGGKDGATEKKVGEKGDLQLVWLLGS